MIGSTTAASGYSKLSEGESCYQHAAECNPGLCCVRVVGKIQDDEEAYTLCHPGGNTEWCDDTFDEETGEKNECDWGYDLDILQCTPMEEENGIITKLSYIAASIAISISLL